MYVLAGTNIKRPARITEENNTQLSQVRTLEGTYKRDYFGSNKRTWTLEFANVSKADFDTINNIYQTYLSTETPQTFQITEGNYTIPQTSVHLTMDDRSFTIHGHDSYSDFSLILIEA